MRENVWEEDLDRTRENRAAAVLSSSGVDLLDRNSREKGGSLG